MDEREISDDEDGFLYSSDAQDIARSSYADMLHDDERNVAYYQAIIAQVNHLVRSKKTNPNGDRFFKCCDIGTGSGLLSMMIVKTFRSLNYKNFSVTAFEAFRPMAKCAKEVIELNGMSNEITVIKQRVECYKENPQYDLVVAELLDTELIGEGCLIAYRHVVENLCSPECVFIPESAQIYIQPLNSKYHHNRQKIQDIKLCWGLLGSIEITDKEAKECCGLSEIDDLHLNDICRLGSDELSAPKIIFEFKFNQLESLKLRDYKQVDFNLKTLDKESRDNCYPVIVMWWDIVMYPKELYSEYIKPEGVHQLPFDILSCAPEWIWRNQYEERNRLILKYYKRDIWREHWLRGVYHLPNVHLMTSKDGEVQQVMNVHAYHDSHSLWFDLKPCETKLPPSCSCNVHRLLSRSAIGFINDADMMSRLTLGLFRLNPVTRSESVKKQICEKAKLIFNHSPNEIESRQISVKAPFWKVEFHYYEFVHIYQKKLVDFCLQDEVCWLVLMNRHLGGLPLDPFVDFHIKCKQVFFDDLNRTRMKVGTCQGFDLTPLDELINDASIMADTDTESLHLYEYKCRDRINDHYDNRMKEINIFSKSKSDYMDTEYIKKGSWNKPITIEAPCADYEYLRNHWALVFWADLELANGRTIDTGFWSLGNSTLRFSPHFKQLVHFLHPHPALDNDNGSPPVLELKIRLSRNGLSVYWAKEYAKRRRCDCDDCKPASVSDTAPATEMDVGTCEPDNDI